MKILNAIFGGTFGLFFAGVGFYIAGETALPTFTDWLRMRDWQPGTAQLLSVQGGENFVAAEYRYRVNGYDYSGDRVYLSQFKDNIGSYHSNLYARLRRALNNQQAVEIWVNPTDPAQAVIDKDMRWGFFALMSGFCGVFILIGITVCYFSVFAKPNTALAKRKHLQKLRHAWQRHNDMEKVKISFDTYVAKHAPELSDNIGASPYQSGHLQSGPFQSGAFHSGEWQQRKGWQSNRIRSGAKAGVWLMWVFAVFWNGISTPLLFQVPTEIEKQNYAILIGLLFPLIGLFIIYKAVVTTMEYLRFGVVEFSMDPYPGSIGGHVGGVIGIKRLQFDGPAVRTAKFNVLLECVYSYVSGTGKNRSRRENILWAEQGEAKIQRSAFGIQLSFHFNVPNHLPEADVERGSEYHFWRLKVSAELSGADLDRTYDIPVFKTGEQTSGAQHDISAQVEQYRQEQSQIKADAIAKGDFHLTDLAKSVKVQELGNEVRLYFPMFRNKGLTLFAAIFTGGFSFATFGIVNGFGSGGGLFAIFAFVFSIPFALVALISVVALIYLPLNNLSVAIAGNKLTSVRRLLFFPMTSKTSNFNEISELSIKRSGSVGQGVNKVEYFKILAHGRNGDKITVAEDINGEDLANHFKDYVAMRLGKV